MDIGQAHTRSGRFERAAWMRAAVDAPILIVPGLNNSGPDHWQTHWEQALPNAERVNQDDWDQPSLDDWTATLVEAVRRRPGSVLVAHSLGCALVAHVARISGHDIGAALLVAPADVSRDRPAGPLLQGFSPMPRGRLPFPSMVVASRNDPYVTIERAAGFAANWGSTFVDLGFVGHINVASGHGVWAEGRVLLAALVRETLGPREANECAEIRRAGMSLSAQATAKS